MVSERVGLDGRGENALTEGRCTAVMINYRLIETIGSLDVSFFSTYATKQDACVRG